MDKTRRSGERKGTRRRKITIHTMDETAAGARRVGWREGEGRLSVLSRRQVVG